ncbi:nitrous oxide reductase family maturation protein NosD [Rhodobacter maris]|uniref:Nitrous oxidase accessory protein n=1 Tax=Rhodobacter maris TaxID=446682 RepID=A0A285T6I1_9RHOB|nr:nitrous oxide reductase family maturation protein NosD [Rhodobacter maris]SOC16960.1 nitrous oxidase accessory protein [Rhodobacter maris]
MRLPCLFLALSLLAHPLQAETVPVSPGEAALRRAIAAASPGDVLRLTAGLYGPAVIDKPLTLEGAGAAVIDGGHRGTVLRVTADDVTLRGLIVQGSGARNEDIDAGIKVIKGVARTRIEGNLLRDNMHGIDFHGAIDALARGNTVLGRRDAQMNARGNGFYVWNAPGVVIEDNVVRWGRDGIFSNTSRKDIFRRNRFSDLRFAIHYMYTNDSVVADNISIGNHLGFAMMYSRRLQVTGNISLSDRDHGVMLNSTNDADVIGNLVIGAAKCTFLYDANKNLIAGNRFEGCGIGIHYTAGSARNAVTGNAFIGNRTQVKYVGSRDLEWSLEGRGNYWSDLAAFDLNGDGRADQAFRPNDLMDHILWSQPAAALLTGAPVVQLIRWSQASFPATLPGGILDSHPLMAPIDIPLPPDLAARAAEPVRRWAEETGDDAEPDLSH